MLIAGINAFHGDASVALFRDGDLLRSIEEERLNRIKHSAGFPVLAAQACLGGEVPEHVAISRDPRAHLGRKLLRAMKRRNYSRLLARGRNNLQIARIRPALEAYGIANRHTRVHFVEHHRSHLASAFFCSPFESAAVVSIDGFGDFISAMWGIGQGNHIEIKSAVHFPHSLGLFYTAFTQYLGFPKYGDEYKMMGLAAYGEPRFVKQLGAIVQTAGDQCRLDLDYFIHDSEGVEMTWADGEPVLSAVYSRRLPQLFGESPRQPGSEIRQFHTDLACSAQQVLEENYFALLQHVQRRTGQKNLCLAGGVALNCVANGHIFDRTDFQHVYVQPAAHDGGTSIGAALYVQHEILKRPRSFVMRHVFYGPEYSDHQIETALGDIGAVSHKLDAQCLIAETAAQLSNGKVVGWFQGRMEFGPRALGNRSILADPRRPEMKDILNSRIKGREPFRPFCPSILSERLRDYFDADAPSPFMLMAYQVKPAQRDAIPAVIHQDGTCRVQTVEREVNPLYWELIRKFGELTGVPVLLNTSFNENEPIVNTPAEAIDCFARTSMDVLAIGPYLVLKSENPQLGPQASS